MNLPPAALSLRDSDAACDLQNNGPKGGRNNMGTISIQMFAEDPIPRPPNDPLIYPQISTIKGHKDSMKKPFGGGGLGRPAAGQGDDRWRKRHRPRAPQLSMNPESPIPLN